MKYKILMVIVGTGCKSNRTNCKCIKQRCHCSGGQYRKYVLLDQFYPLLAKRRHIRVSQLGWCSYKNDSGIHLQEKKQITCYMAVLLQMNF